MNESVKTITCSQCGASLNVEINRAFVFCQYCGCKNLIESEKMKVAVSAGIANISASTDEESLLNTVNYLISIGKYVDANKYLESLFLTGNSNYKLYICKAKIDLCIDNNKSLFDSMKKLREFEKNQDNTEVTDAICELMSCRGFNGVGVLHNATFHELYDEVVYCVEHHADVNLIAGMNRVTPISIMFVPISKSLSRLDGTPFIRNKAMVKQIRKYLMANGAVDKFRLGY